MAARKCSKSTPCVNKCDGLLSFACRAGWVFDKVVFQSLLVVVQFAAGALPAQAAEACKAAFGELVAVALHGAWGDSGEVGNLGVAQSLALQPEDLHLALDAGMGVMVTLVAKLRHDFRAEGEGKTIGPEPVVRVPPLQSRGKPNERCSVGRWQQSARSRSPTP